MKDQAIAVVKLYLLNESQASVIDTTSGIITDSGKTLSGKLGDKYNTLAKEVADNIKTSVVRNSAVLMMLWHLLMN
ncbi:hypothetical protein [Klebsiella quasipneumoniae]|uniref:hypothetical protein n=1 Tax=Klebsiella quasipneumoniae TaxID=1463165 RepID=UPI0038909A36